MSEEKLARNIIRSLPKKFDMKVITIEEAKDLSNIKVDELIDSLQTFEMAINDRSEKKNKSIDFVSNTGEDEDQGEEILLDDIVHVERKFNKALRRLDRKWRRNFQDKVSYISPHDKSIDEDKPNRGKEAQCYECEYLVTLKLSVLLF